jgi:hypothetical protein
MVEYAAATTPKYDDPLCVVRRKEVELQFENDHWREKMHRYPASIRDIGRSYTVPTIVSIGPYHHGLDHLKKGEEAKYAAVCSCISQSEYSVQQMYDAVVSVASEARNLYDKDTMAGIHHENNFCPMMFYDACFLVQFMIYKSRQKDTIHPWLQIFFKSNKDHIYHDILLLENQLPRVVMEIFELFMPVNLKKFAKRFEATLQNSRISTPPKVVEVKSSAIHDSTSASYKAPHLLGYVRFYIVGTNKFEKYKPEETTKVKSFSVSAVELAEMGITLTPNSTTTELAHIGFKEGRLGLSAELLLPHILLSYVNASFLVNMAAFEITSNPSNRGEDTAVCSYVQLLGMLMDKEEDVQELRAKRLLQGGGGLTDKEALDLFTSLHGVTMGPLYHRTIRNVEMYKQNKGMWVQVYAFFYKYKKTMLAVLSAIATMFAIFGAFNKSR